MKLLFCPRWTNQLDPSIKRGEWTQEEDETIVALQLEHGNQVRVLDNLHFLDLQACSVALQLDRGNQVRVLTSLLDVFIAWPKTLDELVDQTALRRGGIRAAAQLQGCLCVAQRCVCVQGPFPVELGALCLVGPVVLVICMEPGPSWPAETA